MFHSLSAITMLLNVFKLFLLLCCVIPNECCTKETFKNTIVTIGKGDDILNLEYDAVTITGCITPQKLGNGIIVKEITCYGQDIPIIYQKAVSNFPELESLEIAKSKIKQIKGNAFFNLPKLSFLLLGDNEIATIDESAFKNLKLTYLNLQSNKIVSLEHRLLLKDVNQIDLSHNKIKAFESEWFMESSNLRSLKISNNLISSIQKHAFKPFRSLIFIDISSNDIHYVHKEAFQDLNKLRHLYLNDNKVKTLHKDLFQSLRALSDLRLQRNNLTYMSNVMLRDLTHNPPMELTIHTNPWQCACYDRIVEWAEENSVTITNRKRCYHNENPICAVPEKNGDQCLEIREEDLDAHYYSSVNHTCDTYRAYNTFH